MDANSWLDQINPRINVIWRGDWKPGTVEPGRRIFDHELVMVMRGQCTVRIDATPHELQRGEFIIVPPGTYHTTTTPDGVHRLCIHFDWLKSQPASQGPLWVYDPPGRMDPALLKKAPALVPAESPLKGAFDPSGSDGALAESIVHRWRTRDAFSVASAHIAFAELLLHLLWRRECPPSTRPHLGDRSTQLAFAVKDLLDNAARGTVDIQTLLPSLGFSYAHLCRVFRGQFGLSPVRYLNAVRLERAKHLLKDPKLSIADAAYGAGFNHPSYFTRMYRAHFGTAPRHSRDLS